MKLHNRNRTYLNTLAEGTPEPDIKPRVTRWIYFGILISAMLYLTYIVSDRVMYRDATGQVEVENIAISASHSGRLETVAVVEGQVVKKGELIAKIAASRDCIEQPDKSANQLRYDIELNKSRIELFRIRLGNLKQPQQEELIRRALEVSRDKKSQQEKLRKEKQKIREEIVLLSREVKLQKKKLSLQDLSAMNKTVSVECEAEIILAPFDGVIQGVLRRSQEFTKRGDPIVMLANEQASVSIFARFEQKDLRSLSVGKILGITFPDGETSRGLVNTVYSADYAQLSGSNPVKRELRGTVRVRVSAIDEQSRQQWKRYDRMDVVVRAEK